MDKPNNFDKQIHHEKYKEDFMEPVINYCSMIQDCGRQKESLNGVWNYQVDPYDACLRAEWFLEKMTDEEGKAIPYDIDFNYWDEAHVPSCWNTSNASEFNYEGPVVYTRTFNYINHGEDRVVLKIGAANYEARIFINQKFIGFHSGGSTPFFIDVTNYLEYDNRLVILVDNTRKSEHVPTDHTDWFNYGGLYRDVELVRLPEAYIKDYSLKLVMDGCYNKIQIALNTAGKMVNGRAVLEIEELGLRQLIDVIEGYGEAVIPIDCQLWTPDEPKLYECLISYGSDKIVDHIGFRSVQVSGTDIYLNGEKILLKGIAVHEESVKHGKYLTDDEIRENIRLAKSMNCNYMRLAHYPHSERVAQIADEEGMMLWEEIPVYWSIEFANNKTYEDAKNQLTELILRDSNRASVIIWSVGNENPDTVERLKFMKGLVTKVRKLDSSRLVSAACLVDKVNNVIADPLTEFIDVIGINEYYGWYDPDFGKLAECFYKSKPKKPVIITEFGAGALAGHRGSRDELFTEEQQEEVYKQQVKVLGDIPYIKGISPWILYDFRSPKRVNRFQKGYNRKGLLSEDKEYIKKAYYVMKDFYKDWQEVKEQKDE